MAIDPNDPKNMNRTQLESEVRRLRESEGPPTIPAEDDDTPDVIDNPSHYGGRDNPYEVLKVMIAWYGAEETATFCRLNAVKYLARAGKKRTSVGDDFRKAAWYAEAAANLLEHGRFRK